MNQSELTPARKKQFIIGAVMMLVVIVLALVVAFHGEEIYMRSEGYFKTCSPVGSEMVCQYCRCPPGMDGGPGFGGADCDGGSRPRCVGAQE